MYPMYPIYQYLISLFPYLPISLSPYFPISLFPLSFILTLTLTFALTLTLTLHPLPGGPEARLDQLRKYEEILSSQAFRPREVGYGCISRRDVGSQLLGEIEDSHLNLTYPETDAFCSPDAWVPNSFHISK